MRLSHKGRALLTQMEGKSNHVYEDVAGFKTIGIGHLLKLGETMTYLTDEQIDDLLDDDLSKFELAVTIGVHVPLTQHQFDALVIFAFNVGVTAFSTSTLVKKLNAGDYNSVPSQLMRWNKAGGKVVSGLTNRRKKEIELWEGIK